MALAAPRILKEEVAGVVSCDGAFVLGEEECLALECCRVEALTLRKTVKGNGFEKSGLDSVLLEGTGEAGGRELATLLDGGRGR